MMTTSTSNATDLSCVECGAELETEITMAGEILDCGDCGVELEVRSLDPVQLGLAPEVEEDWGE